MLLRQNFGRCHQCALPTGVNGQHGRQSGHHGFACAHIPLKQTVHRDRTGQILADFFANPLLRSGQLKRQSGLKLIVPAPLFGFQGRCTKAVSFLFGHVLRELLRQQFFGFEALPGRVATVF